MEYELIKPDDNETCDPVSFLSHARQRARELAERVPDVGDTVHLWHSHGCRFAVVTEDDLTTWSVSFLMPGETSWRPVREVAHDENKAEMTWHWPCGGR